jgi:hypothetical protein
MGARRLGRRGRTTQQAGLHFGEVFGDVAEVEHGVREPRKELEMKEI